MLALLLKYGSLSNLYSYGAVPVFAVAVTVTLPVLLPWQSTFVWEVIVAVNTAGSVIITPVTVTKHEFASVTVTE